MRERVYLNFVSVYLSLGLRLFEYAHYNMSLTVHTIQTNMLYY